MKLLRESNKKLPWISGKRYKMSFYNISDKNDKFTAIYNSASGAVVLIETSILEKAMFSENVTKELVENGILVPSETNEFQEYFSKLRFSQKEKPNFFTIIPTTGCNAHCFYCYEEEYCKQTIDPFTHKKIVDYLAAKISDLDEFVLDWYGGEPLLCVQEIDHIIQDLLSNTDMEVKKWKSSITTNATLFTPELVKHAVTYWHLDSAHITIDGIEEDHNARKNVKLHGESAFAKTVNAIHNLLDEGVYVNLRIHLDNNNKESFPLIMQSLNDFFHYERFHLFPTFLFPPESKMPETYITDAQKEHLFYNVFKEVLNSSYSLTLSEAFPLPKLQNCFATKCNTIVIAPDSSLHSCVQEFSGCGNDKKFEDYSAYCKKCKNCKFFPICLGGCIHNRSLTETVRTPCVRNRFVVRPLLKILLEENYEKINLEANILLETPKNE